MSFSSFLYNLMTPAFKPRPTDKRRARGLNTIYKCFIGVNRPAFGGTVPHFHQMSRGPTKSADVPHFSKLVLLFFPLPINDSILHVCLATQQSDELRIKIGSEFARRQATDYKYTVGLL